MRLPIIAILAVLYAGCVASGPPFELHDLGTDLDTGEDAQPMPAHFCRVSGAIADLDTDPVSGSCCGGHFSMNAEIPRCCNGGIGATCMSDLDCCGFHMTDAIRCVFEGRGATFGKCCVTSTGCGCGSTICE